MGEAKRRKQLLGSAYGVSSVTLEKCVVPKEITFAYVDDLQIEKIMKIFLNYPVILNLFCLVHS
ncbi:MAG: hypothetical protein HC908_05825 [Calothrix sp. SM1_7_51]|nr:hypothetical protein [Calothrix sp. SM1_7_51]